MKQYLKTLIGVLAYLAVWVVFVGLISLTVISSPWWAIAAFFWGATAITIGIELLKKDLS